MKPLLCLRRFLLLFGICFTGILYLFQSDDSLEHLSPEERACLMFLEETIESLDAEDDSGLSNDEPDQLPGLGNLATKLADLSASMNKSKFNSELICEDRWSISYL